MADERPPPYGLTVLVAMGWYATIIGGVLAGDATIPHPAPGCAGEFGCGLGEALLKAACIAGGFLVMLPTALIAGPVSRRIPWPAISGTLTAFLSIVTLFLIVIAVIVIGAHR